MALYRPELWVQSGYPGDYTCTFKVAGYIESDPGAVTQVIISRNWNGAAEGIVLYYDNTADQMSVVWFTNGGSTFEQAVLSSRPAINEQFIAYLQSSASTVKGGWAPLSSPTSWTSNQTTNPLPAHGSNNAISLTSNANGAYMTAQNWCGWNEVLSETTLSGEIYDVAVYRTNLVFEHKLNDGDVTSPWPDSSGNGNDATQQGGLAPTNRTNFLSAPGPTITAQPQNQTVNNGATASFSVTATGGTAPLTYQWQDDSGGSFANISGATSNPYTPTASYAAQGRQYRCVVTDANSLTATSAAATLRVASNLTGTGPRVYPGFGHPWGVGAYGSFTRGTVTAGGPITIGQASETDTSQALTSRQLRGIGQTVETDTAQPATLRQSRTVGQVTETDSAFAVSSRQTRALGQPAEADTSQPLTAAQRLAAGIASETDTAQIVTVGPSGAGLGQPQETDSAQPAASVQAKAIGQPSEADSALATTARRQLAIGQPSEADSALAAVVVRRQAVGLVTEADVAQAVAVRQGATIGQPIETDSAQQASGAGAQILNPAAEADSAQPVVRRQAKAVGITVETDAAQAVAASLRGSIGQAIEIDAAQAATSRLARAIGQPAETDAALAVLRRLQWQIGQAAEVDEAWTFSAPGYEDDPSIFWRYEVPAYSLRFDIPAASLRFDVPAEGLRFDVPSIGAGITIN